MLDVAIKIAEANPIKDLPRMGAIITDSKGKTIAVGLNKKKSHPLQKTYGRNIHSIWLHAEIDALRRALKTHSAEDLKSCCIYIARVRKDGLPALAQPCAGCEKALKDHGITQVFWTEDD